MDSSRRARGRAAGNDTRLQTGGKSGRHACEPGAERARIHCQGDELLQLWAAALVQVPALKVCNSSTVALC